MATRKPRVPKEADDKEQSERFIRAARDAQTDDNKETFERAFANVVRKKPSKERKGQI